MIAAAVDRLRGIFRPPDPRTPEELESDLADELAFHLDGLEREALASGADPDSARAEARRRFGDPDRIRAACRRVALEERFMLQRVNAVLTVILLIAVVAMGVQLYLGQVENARTLDQLHVALDALAQKEADARSGAARGEGPEPSPAPRALPFVYLDSDVARPGSYELPSSGLSVQRLIAAAGGRPSGEDVNVIVFRAGTRVFQAQWSGTDSASLQDSVLQPGDLVVVRRPAQPAAPPASEARTTPVASNVRIKGPVRVPVAIGLDGGSRSLRAVMTQVGGLGLVAQHIDAVEVVASIRRPRGDGGFDEMTARWRGADEVPESPRVVANDFVELTLNVLAPPAPLPAETVLELPMNVLLNTARLVQDAIAKARGEDPGAAWPSGTAERLEEDLAVLAARIKARGGEWPERTPRSPAPSIQDNDRSAVSISGDVVHPGKFTFGEGSWRLQQALWRAGGINVPRYFRDSVRVTATFQRPRGDGGKDVLHASWPGGDPPPEEPKLFIGDAMEVRLVPVGPPRALTEDERLAMSPRELAGCASFVRDAISMARDFESRGEWPQGSTARLEADLAVIVDRIKALGGTWPPAREPSSRTPHDDGGATAPKSAGARAEGAVPATLDLTTLGSMTKQELQSRLQAVANARTLPELDEATKRRLKSEFDALLVAVRGRQ